MASSLLLEQLALKKDVPLTPAIYPLSLRDLFVTSRLWLCFLPDANDKLLSDCREHRERIANTIDLEYKWTFRLYSAAKLLSFCPPRFQRGLSSECLHSRLFRFFNILEMRDQKGHSDFDLTPPPFPPWVLRGSVDEMLTKHRSLRLLRERESSHQCDRVCGLVYRGISKIPVGAYGTPVSVPAFQPSANVRTMQMWTLYVQKDFNSKWDWKES